MYIYNRSCKARFAKRIFIKNVNYPDKSLPRHFEWSLLMGQSYYLTLS